MKAISVIPLILLVALSCQNESNNFVQLASGYELYQKNCSNCHGDDGSGLAKLIPPLKNSTYLNLNKDSLHAIIRNGMQLPIVVNGISYTSPMPGNPKITDAEATAIIEFILIKFKGQSEK
jgi:mono/diheme cytochrome c family protein